MGFLFDLKRNSVIIQKSGKKVKFENEDYTSLLRVVCKISRRLKKREDLLGVTWSGFTVTLKRVTNIGGIVLEALQ